MTPADIITDARVLLNDTSATAYRQSDTTMLGFVQQTLHRIALLRPDLFIKQGTIPVVAGTVYQALPAGAVRLVDIYATSVGTSVSEVDREVLDRTDPAWRQASGTPTNFMRNPRDPVRFMLYPAPAAGVSVEGEYVASPAAHALSDPITELPEAYRPILVDGVVFLASSVDDEHVNTGRAKLFYDAFSKTLQAGVESRKVTDDDYAALDMKKVS